MDKKELIKKLKDISESMKTRQFHQAELRVNLLIGKIMGGLSCINCDAEAYDLCVCSNE